MSYLIDTNIICEVVKASPNKKVIAWLETIPAEALYLSVLTLGEIRKGIESVKNAEKKQSLHFWLEHDLCDWFEERILPIDRLVADYWGKVQAQAKRTLPAIDSLIAATALHYEYTLVTRNSTDFNFPTLKLINPFEYSA